MATLTQTVSANVDGDGVAFSFNQFNPALGTLNSVTVTILSSVDSNYFSVANDNNTSLSVKTPKDYFTLFDHYNNVSIYDGSNVTLITTPPTSGAGYSLAKNSSQIFTVVPTSLINNTPVNIDLTADAAAYIGTGSINFGAIIAPNITISGGTATIDMSTVINNTTLVLTYTYTPSSSTSTIVARLSSNGVYFTNTYFDEITYTSSKVALTANYGAEFDEVTNKGLNIAKRDTKDGRVLVSGYFDEVTGIV
jgi:hypothetical protein